MTQLFIQEFVEPCQNINQLLLMNGVKIIVWTTKVKVGRKNNEILGIGDALFDHHVPQIVFLQRRLVGSHCVAGYCKLEIMNLSGTKGRSRRKFFIPFV